MARIQEDSSLLAKKKMIEDYYSSSNNEDQQSIINILNFIRDKPKTGLANKSIQKFLVAKYFSEIEDPSDDFEELVDVLEDAQEDQTG